MHLRTARACSHNGVNMRTPWGKHVDDPPCALCLEEASQVDEAQDGVRVILSQLGSTLALQGKDFLKRGNTEHMEPHKLDWKLERLFSAFVLALFFRWQRNPKPANMEPMQLTKPLEDHSKGTSGVFHGASRKARR